MRKIEEIIFYLFIFSIPFEARLIIKQRITPFNEWMSSFLYGTDILIGLLFLFWFGRFIFSNKKFTGFREFFSKSDYALIGFFAVSAISIFKAQFVGLGFYQLLKLGEFILLYWYIRANVNNIFGLKESFFVLVFSGFFQSLISIGQYITQSSLGLKYLGEPVLKVGIPGVALVVAKGEGFLRSYGTTPHPNILAAFLFLVFFAFYFIYFYRPGFSLNTKAMLLYIPLVFGFLFTFSRVAIFLWITGAITRIWLIFNRRFLLLFLKTFLRLMFITTVTLLILITFLILFYPQVISRLHLSTSDQAVSLRFWYATKGIDTLKQSNFLGVGIGNFIPHLMDTQRDIPLWQYQPIHNIYLLIASEVGVLGIGLFLLFLFLLIKEYTQATNFEKLHHYSFIIILVSFFVMGFFDHFLWTLQQGRIIFWIVLALISIAAQKKIAHTVV